MHVETGYFPSSGRDLTAARALIFDKIIFGAPNNFREISKPYFIFSTLIFRRSQGDLIGRSKEENCRIKENRDNVQAKEYKFIIILTYEFVFTKYPVYSCAGRTVCSSGTTIHFDNN